MKSAQRFWMIPALLVCLHSPSYAWQESTDIHCHTSVHLYIDVSGSLKDDERQNLLNQFYGLLKTNSGIITESRDIQLLPFSENVTSNSIQLQNIDSSASYQELRNSLNSIYVNPGDVGRRTLTNISAVIDHISDSSSQNGQGYTIYIIASDFDHDPITDANSPNDSTQVDIDDWKERGIAALDRLKPAILDPKGDHLLILIGLAPLRQQVSKIVISDIASKLELQENQVHAFPSIITMNLKQLYAFLEPLKIEVKRSGSSTSNNVRLAVKVFNRSCLIPQSSNAEPQKLQLFFRLPGRLQSETQLGAPFDIPEIGTPAKRIGIFATTTPPDEPLGRLLVKTASENNLLGVSDVALRDYIFVSSVQGETPSIGWSFNSSVRVYGSLDGEARNMHKQHLEIMLKSKDGGNGHRIGSGSFEFSADDFNSKGFYDFHDVDIKVDPHELLSLCAIGQRTQIGVSFKAMEAGLSLQDDGTFPAIITGPEEGGNLLQELFLQGSIGSLITFALTLALTWKIPTLDTGKIEEFIGVAFILVTTTLIILYQTTPLRGWLDVLLLPSISPIVGSLNLFLLATLVMRLRGQGAFSISPGAEELADEIYVAVAQRRAPSSEPWRSSRYPHSATIVLAILLILAALAPIISMGMGTNLSCSLDFATDPPHL